MAASLAQTSNAMVFEYFKGRDKKWYVRQKGDNGEIMYVSEGVTNKRDCLKSIATVQREAARAKVMEVELPMRTIKNAPKEGTIPRATVRKAWQHVSDDHDERDMERVENNLERWTKKRSNGKR